MWNIIRNANSLLAHGIFPRNILCISHHICDIHCSISFILLAALLNSESVFFFCSFFFVCFSFFFLFFLSECFLSPGWTISLFFCQFEAEIFLWLFLHYREEYALLSHLDRIYYILQIFNMQKYLLKNSQPRVHS